MNYRVGDCTGRVGLQGSHAIEDDMTVSSEHAVRSDIARLMQAALLKITIPESQGVVVSDITTRYLAQDYVIAAQDSEDQRGSSLGLGQIGEWERDDDYVASHRFCQASSSSGRSQSFRRADSLTIAVLSPSVAILVFRKCTKSSTSSSTASGMCSSSDSSNSRLLILSLYGRNDALSTRSFTPDPDMEKPQSTQRPRRFRETGVSMIAPVE